jgi:hypothetical protein
MNYNFSATEVDISQHKGDKISKHNNFKAFEELKLYSKGSNGRRSYQLIHGKKAVEF